MEALRLLCQGLQTAPASLGAVPDNFYQNLLQYLTMLMQWNARMNLVGATCWQEAVVNLCADSWHLADFLTTLPLPPAPQCWDLGAGAGLPGLPLRLVWQPGTYTLVEAREKRALFLQNVLARCPLPGVGVFRGRAEAFMAKSPKADLVVSRAFLPWQKVLALVTPFMAPGGFVVFLTLTPPPPTLPVGWNLAQSASYTAERQNAQKALEGEPATRYFWAMQPT
jgi:16S rRNA (guanine527-N7)-methyltransferase